jgi:hypothetical protein
MKRTRIPALVVAFALIFSFVNPPRANALSKAGEITLYVVGGITAFVVLIVIGTVLTRDESKMLLTEPPPEENGEEGGVRFGLQCRGPDGQPAVVCW